MMKARLFFTYSGSFISKLAVFATGQPWGHMGLCFEHSDGSLEGFEARSNEGFVGPFHMSDTVAYINKRGGRYLLSDPLPIPGNIVTIIRGEALAIHALHPRRRQLARRHRKRQRRHNLQLPNKRGGTMMKTPIALLTLLALPLFAADSYHVPRTVEGPTNAVWIKVVTTPTKFAELPPFAIHASQPKPTFFIVTGQTNIVDEAGETNVQDIVLSVPYGIQDADGLRSPTAEEWAAWAPWEAAQAAQAFALEVQALMTGADAQRVAAFFGAVTNFPAIVLPTTYQDAQNAMNDAIKAAEDADDWKLASSLNRHSRIAQDVYKDVLAPQGWTGARLAKLAAVLRGGQ